MPENNLDKGLALFFLFIFFLSPLIEEIQQIEEV